MRIVAGDEDVARLTAEAIANPLGRVVGLKVARRRERCEGIAGAPECLGRLAGAKLAAVPHHGWTRTSRRGFGGETNDLFTTVFRKRAARIDVGPYCVAMMNEIKNHDDQRRNRRTRREFLFCGFCEFSVVRSVISERTPFRRQECVPSGDSPAAESGKLCRD